MNDPEGARIFAARAMYEAHRTASRPTLDGWPWESLPPDDMAFWENEAAPFLPVLAALRSVGGP